MLQRCSSGAQGTRPRACRSSPKPWASQAPSLYTAFGDKESLFLECLKRYANPGPKPTSEVIAEAPSARQAAQELLEVSARWFTQRDAPTGCLVASAASSGSVQSERVRAALKDVREANQKALRKRAERDVRQGRLSKTADAQALASMTMAIIQGMSTLARDGAGQKLAAGPGKDCNECVANG